MSLISTNPSQPILLAQGVTAGYADRTILRGLDLAVLPGQIYALLGANGAGKSTALSLFLGFLRPRSGTLRVAGIDPAAEPAKARSQLAYIPENVALYGHLSARENVAYLLHLAGRKESDAAIGAALQAAGLAPAAHDQRVAGFSKGMRQKVSIALALARRVPALLLDEPTSGLDPQATADFHALLDALRRQGVAVLMVTHDLLGAVDTADCIGFLDQGRMAEEVRTAGTERFDVQALHRRYARLEAA
ncbi:ABC transporter ATP-binding protein [Pelomonas sp. Root1444]|uniref:ABC transporter ATP-binding protein n=1 Tax=Pelomonas sp. Root1444 TaxID=1736464 RepID=UPI0007027DF8|nr:ATP-binding cassette domain-containing protein [Pelomonas sp. Root1444]KQY80976.1 ABC transporter ATP-binding protein [Pelomonas sp. Root1444]